MSNESVISLLETTQEYARSMAELQSVIVDGYMDIAETRKTSFGIGYTSVPINENSRMIFRTNKELDDEKETQLIPGINSDQIMKIKNDFEKALKQAIITAKIVGQLNEKYEIVENELNQK